MTKRLSIAGFTLIELLVTVTVILMLVGGGTAAFLDFNHRQELISGAKEMQGHLRMAQSLARIRETPASCDRLDGYIVRTQDLGGVKQVKIIADCSSGEVEQHTFSLSAGVTLGSDVEMTFLGLHGGVQGAGTVQVINTQGAIYEFEVTPGGEITQGGVVVDS